MGYNPCGSNQAMLAHMESLDHGLEPLWVKPDCLLIWNPCGSNQAMLAHMESLDPLWVKPGYACSYGVLRS